MSVMHFVISKWHYDPSLEGICAQVGLHLLICTISRSTKALILHWNIYLKVGNNSFLLNIIPEISSNLCETVSKPRPMSHRTDRRRRISRIGGSVRLISEQTWIFLFNSLTTALRICLHARHFIHQFVHMECSDDTLLILQKFEKKLQIFIN